jgi:hypothetical protein
MAITLPFRQLSGESIHFTEDPTLGKCAVSLMEHIVAKTKQGVYCTNGEIEKLFRLPDKHGYETFLYGSQAKSTAKKQLEAAGYIVSDRIQRGAKGWRAIKECRAASEIPETLKSPYDSLPQRSDNKDFVYVFKRIRDGIYKIGVTGNLRSRASSIACSCGSHLELVAALDTDYAYQTEQELHQHFNNKRLPGEWFELDSTDISRIKGFFSDMQTGGF